MSLNVSYNQTSGIDSQALRAITQEIFKRADNKVANTNANANLVNFKRNTLGVDFYSGRTDAATARQIAMANSGMGLSVNNDLKSTIQFLNNEAAKSIHKQVEGKMTIAANAETQSAPKVLSPAKFNTIVKTSDLSQDKNGSNPFYQGETFVKKSEKNEEDKLNIFA